MISPNFSKQQHDSHFDWNLVYQTLSGTTGVFIGLAIANVLGWI